MKGDDLTVSVLGLGNWGTALANHLAHSGRTVTAWTISSAVADAVNTTHKNCEFLTDLKLSSNIKATTNIKDATRAELVVVAIPSQALSEIVGDLPKTALVVSAVKGLEPNSELTPLKFFESKGLDPEKLVVLSGPSFARDVSYGKPSSVVAASTSIKSAEKIAAIFSNSSMRVYPSDDPTGVELGGIVKNVIALAAGVSDGLDFGDSARAGIITRGLAEMMRLIKALGGKEQTVFGLSGLGDLAMTASSPLSRNRTVGYRLGKGEKLSEIVKSLGSVAEAVTVTPHVVELASKYQVEMPITEAVSAVLQGKATPEELARKLIQRPIKKEF